MKYFRASIWLFLASSLACFTVQTSPASAANLVGGPDVVSCPSSGQAYEIVTSSITEEGVGTIFSVHNVGKTTVVETMTKTLSGTYTGTVTSTVSGNVNFLISSIDASLSVSLEKTVSTSVSTSITVSVPSGDWGLIQGAAMIVVTNGILGNYEGGSVNANGLCSLANAANVTTSFPESNYNSYFASGTATSSTPPWIQAS